MLNFPTIGPVTQKAVIVTELVYGTEHSFKTCLQALTFCNEHYQEEIPHAKEGDLCTRNYYDNNLFTEIVFNNDDEVYEVCHLDHLKELAEG